MPGFFPGGFLALLSFPAQNQYKKERRGEKRGGEERGGEERGGEGREGHD